MRASTDVTTVQDQEHVVTAGDQNQAGVTPHEKVIQSDKTERESRSKSGRVTDKISRNSSKRSSEHKSSRHGSRQRGTPVIKTEKSRMT